MDQQSTVNAAKNQGWGFYIFVVYVRTALGLFFSLLTFAASINGYKAAYMTKDEYIKMIEPYLALHITFMIFAVLVLATGFMKNTIPVIFVNIQAVIGLLHLILISNDPKMMVSASNYSSQVVNIAIIAAFDIYMMKKLKNNSLADTKQFAVNAIRYNVVCPHCGNANYFTDINERPEVCSQCGQKINELQ